MYEIAVYERRDLRRSITHTLTIAGVRGRNQSVFFSATSRASWKMGNSAVINREADREIILFLLCSLFYFRNRPRALHGLMVNKAARFNLFEVFINDKIRGKRESLLVLINLCVVLVVLLLLFWLQ